MGSSSCRSGRFDAPLYVTRRPATAGGSSSSSRRGGSSSSAAASRRPQPFLDIRSKVTAGGEQGLLSMAFAPDYAQTGLFYVYYTEKSGTEAIWEYHRASADRADPDSARLVLRMDDPEPNHNGGLMLFGPDKLLYVGTGDGGGGNDQHGTRGNAQDARLAAGQDPAHRPARSRARKPYTIPSSNPFVGRAGARGEIYSYGLRNPWRFSFDRATDDLVIGDVGQDEVEEIDFVKTRRRARRELRLAPVGGPPAQLRRAGAAARSSPSSPTPTRRASARSPAASSRAIAAVPGLYGRYVYGDYCNDRLRVAHAARRPARPEPDPRGAGGLGRLVVRRGHLGAGLRGLAQRAGLSLRGALTGVDRRHAAMIPRVSGRPSVDSVARRADPERVERLFDLVEQAIRAQVPARPTRWWPRCTTTCRVARPSARRRQPAAARRRRGVGRGARRRLRAHRARRRGPPRARDLDRVRRRADARARRRRRPGRAHPPRRRPRSPGRRRGRRHRAALPLRARWTASRPTRCSSTSPIRTRCWPSATACCARAA